MPIKFVQGNLIKAEVEARVIPVNCVGTMSKGLALQAKQEWPALATWYSRLCSRHFIKPGSISSYVMNTDQEIILAATKDHWWNPSQMAWIETIIETLSCYCLVREIDIIAIPPIGCGLDWDSVRPLLIEAFQNHPTHALVYCLHDKMPPQPSLQLPCKSRYSKAARIQRHP